MSEQTDILLDALKRIDLLLSDVQSEQNHAFLLELRMLLEAITAVPPADYAKGEKFFGKIAAASDQIASLQEKLQGLPKGQKDAEIAKAISGFKEQLQGLLAPVLSSSTHGLVRNDRVLAAPLGVSPPAGQCPFCGEDMSQCSCSKGRR